MRRRRIAAWAALFALFMAFWWIQRYTLARALVETALAAGGLYVVQVQRLRRADWGYFITGLLILVAASDWWRVFG